MARDDKKRTKTVGKRLPGVERYDSTPGLRGRRGEAENTPEAQMLNKARPMNQRRSSQPVQGVRASSAPAAQTTGGAKPQPQAQQPQSQPQQERGLRKIALDPDNPNRNFIQQEEPLTGGPNDTRGRPAENVQQEFRNKTQAAGLRDKLNSGAFTSREDAVEARERLKRLETPVSGGFFSGLTEEDVTQMKRRDHLERMRSIRELEEEAFGSQGSAVSQLQGLRSPDRFTNVLNENAMTEEERQQQARDLSAAAQADQTALQGVRDRRAETESNRLQAQVDAQTSAAENMTEIQKAQISGAARVEAARLRSNSQGRTRDLDLSIPQDRRVFAENAAANARVTLGDTIDWNEETQADYAAYVDNFTRRTLQDPANALPENFDKSDLQDIAALSYAISKSGSHKFNIPGWRRGVNAPMSAGEAYDGLVEILASQEGKKAFMGGQEVNLGYLKGEAGQLFQNFALKARNEILSRGEFNETTKKVLRNSIDADIEKLEREKKEAVGEHERKESRLTGLSAEDEEPSDAAANRRAAKQAREQAKTRFDEEIATLTAARNDINEQNYTDLAARYIDTPPPRYGTRNG